jgi:hypothetical protein
MVVGIFVDKEELDAVTVANSRSEVELASQTGDDLVEVICLQVLHAIIVCN